MNDVPGDSIETGVWRGGACIYMRGILEAYGDARRRVFVGSRRGTCGWISNDGHRFFFGAGGSQIWGPLVESYLTRQPAQ
jgi:hypothetical protein